MMLSHATYLIFKNEQVILLGEIDADSSSLTESSLFDDNPLLDYEVSLHV